MPGEVAVDDATKWIAELVGGVAHFTCEPYAPQKDFGIFRIRCPTEDIDLARATKGYPILDVHSTGADDEVASPWLHTTASWDKFDA